MSALTLNKIEWQAITEVEKLAPGIEPPAMLSFEPHRTFAAKPVRYSQRITMSCSSA